MKTLLALFCFLMMAGCSETRPLWDGTIVDLSYAYDSTTIYWPTEKGFALERGPAGMTPGGYYYSANRFWTPEHGGTHIDAPIHFSENQNTVDQIPLEQLVGPGVVVDVSEQCMDNRDYRVTTEDFLAWESEFGRIPDEAIILIRTGFGRYWPDRKEYLGTEKRGNEAVAELHFPGLHPDAAVWLIAERRIRAVGLDTPSIDYGQSSRFESHVALFAHNIPAFENVANLNELPATNFTVIAFPMKIRGGSGGPVRIAAILPGKQQG